MELIKGVPITEFCDKNKLTTRQRLELFIPVCQAIQHAHMKGIIHRDIKPSNVMIALYDGKPTPKVIDFGVAKAMAEPLTQRTLFTHVGQIVGTFEYMSPEQATLNQLDIDTRSDIYSLGVLLYELLTGLTPIDKDHLRALALDQMLKAIREEEPMRPSARMTSNVGALATAAIYRGVPSQKLAELLRGEIDWIVMKCLEKDRDRRFLTATSLAQDIERYLRDEPVSACPPTLGYRAKKFFRKNKAFMTTIGTVAALLLIGIAGTSWQAVRAKWAEEDAIARAKEADDERKKTERALLLAEDNERKERDARLELRRSHYNVSMHQIQAAWDAENAGRALELLNNLRPRPGDKVDLRGFEWHYWDRLCGASRSLKLDFEFVGITSRECVISGDGSKIVFLQAEPDAEEKTGNKSRRNQMNRVNLIDLTDGKLVKTWSIPKADDVCRLTINHNGTRVALASKSSLRKGSGLEGPCQVRVWGSNSETEIFAVGEQQNLIAALSADGNTLATIEKKHGEVENNSEGWCLVVRDLTKPKDLNPMRIDIRTVDYWLAPALNKDGSRVAYLHGDGDSRKIQIWETKTGANLRTTTSINSLESLLFSQNGSHLTGVERTRGGAARSRAIFYVWEIGAEPGLELVRTIKTSVLHSIDNPRQAVSPDGRSVALYAGGGHVVQVFDIKTGAERRTIKLASFVPTAAFNADGTSLITAGGITRQDYTAENIIVQEWQLPPFTEPILPKKKEPLIGGTFKFPIGITSPSGKYRVEIKGTKMTVYDVATDEEISRFLEHKKGPFIAVRFSPNGKNIWSTTLFGESHIWETESGKLLYTFTPSLNKTFVVPVRRGQKNVDNTYLLLNLENEKKLVKFDDPTKGIVVFNTRNFGFSPDGQRLAILEPTLKVFDVESGRVIASLPANCKSAMFSPDSRAFLAVEYGSAPAADFKLTIWDARTGEIRGTLKDDLPHIWNRESVLGPKFVTLSPDGNRAVIQTYPRNELQKAVYSVFDIKTGQKLFRLDGAASRVVLAFSPDGKRIATVDDITKNPLDTVVIWDAETGHPLLKLTPRAAELGRLRLSFTGDGQRLTLNNEGVDETWDATPRPQ